MMVMTCVRLASGGTDFVSMFFRDVVQLMSGAQISFLVLIDYYICDKYPEFLRIRALRDKLILFREAWDYLSTMDEHERLYVKLLRPRSDTQILNRNNFPLLSQVATAIAKAETPSMVNYRGGQVTSLETSFVQLLLNTFNEEFALQIGQL